MARLRKYVLRSKVEDRRTPPRSTPRPSAGDQDWELAESARGIPQVYATTTEQFVAQMLNLDLQGAIAFDKGCYTGQEVIARAHYCGRVKRRMQRWLNPSGTELKPGDAARGPDGRGLWVVRAAPAESGRNCSRSEISSRNRQRRRRRPVASPSAARCRCPMRFPSRWDALWRARERNQTCAYPRRARASARDGCPRTCGRANCGAFERAAVGRREQVGVGGADEHPLRDFTEARQHVRPACPPRPPRHPRRWPRIRA